MPQEVRLARRHARAGAPAGRHRGAYEAGVHATLISGSFSVYRMEDPSPEVGYVETPKGTLYVESPESESMMQMYDRLWDASLPAEASVEFITTLSKELR
ncbi:Scr1 family TA system antitoxin-like transcriptional regulator [Nocardiopsis sp. NPDC006198]|uniref:Scr1 family TA system antitoxin-like transcriptional regulator n=1 Tax=Nocardiopsis sp. NPDC006198 TaxID=3154472 RepID=UPI00339EB584